MRSLIPHPVFDTDAARHQREDAAEMVADLRFRRHVEQIHSLGARVVGELLAEIGSERSIQTIIDEKIARYAAIDLSALAAVGGDDFPPAPLHVVPR